MDENNDGTLTEEEFLKGCLMVTNLHISHISHMIKSSQMSNNQTVYTLDSYIQSSSVKYHSFYVPDNNK